MKDSLVTGLFVLTVVFSCAARTGASRGTNNQKSQPGAEAGVGGHIPDFCLKDLDGHEVCSSQFRGKTLLIDFWASWCGPCKTEMPAYEKYQERYGARGLRVIGIGLSMDTPSNLKKFAEKMGVHYTLLMGTMEVQDKFGLKGIPTTILVDKQGVIRKQVVGFDYPNKLDKLIQDSLR